MKSACRDGRSIVFLMVCISFLPGALGAQADPDSVKLRNNCRLASQVLDHGQPANKREWALLVLPSCDPDLQFRTIESLVRSAAYEGGPGAIEDMDAAWSFWDRRILEFLLEVAGDPAAIETARLQSLMILSIFLRPEWTLDDGFTAKVMEHGYPLESCFGRADHPYRSRAVPEVPDAEFREYVRRELRALDRSTAPATLQGAIFCAGWAARASSGG